MAIGKLRHRITIQEPTETTDNHGGYTESWSTFATVWARISPMSASEKHFADKLEEEVTHKIKIRSLSGLSAKMRIQFGSRIFKIVGHRDIEERGKFMEINALEESAT